MGKGLESLGKDLPKAKSIPKRSLYWTYQQIKTLQASASWGELLVNTITALAVISPLSLLHQVTPCFIPSHQKGLHSGSSPCPSVQEDAHTRTLAFRVRRRQLNPPPLRQR